MTKNKKYRVVCYMRIDADDVEPMSHEDATKEVLNCECMDSENIYKIEEIEEEGEE